MSIYLVYVKKTRSSPLGTIEIDHKDSSITCGHDWRAGGSNGALFSGVQLR